MLPLIKSQGFLFISDAVWLTDSPSPACAEYWKIEYPTMTDAETRKKQSLQKGYTIISSFTLPREDWNAFYDEMELFLKRTIQERGMTQACRDMINEIEIDREYGHEYGYLCLLLQKTE